MYFLCRKTGRWLRFERMNRYAMPTVAQAPMNVYHVQAILVAKIMIVMSRMPPPNPMDAESASIFWKGFLQGRGPANLRTCRTQC